MIARVGSNNGIHKAWMSDDGVWGSLSEDSRSETVWEPTMSQIPVAATA